MFFGYKIMAAGSFLGIPLNLTVGKYGEQVTKAQEYTEALKNAAGEQAPMSFIDTFANMLSRTLPAGLDKELLSSTMDQWKNFWMFPSIMAGIVLVIFALTFWDKMKPSAEETQNADAENLF